MKSNNNLSNLKKGFKILTNQNFIMKTKNYVFASILLVSLLFSTSNIAQEKETYGMAELSFMMPKVGMETAFENAVKEHNNMYHKDGPYKASLDKIITGKQAGWYAWLMGPCTFTDLDKRPVSAAHDKHWDDKVTPTIAKYGSNEYWKHNPKLSYQSGSEGAKLEEIWFLDLKRGDYYRFKELMTKIKGAFEKKGDGHMHVYENQFGENNGRDVAVVWGMNGWSDFDKDNGGIKKEYEEMNGEGTWQNAMDEWEEITESIVRQVWKIGI